MNRRAKRYRYPKVLGSLATLTFMVYLAPAAQPQRDLPVGIRAIRPHIVISSAFPPLDVIPVKGARQGDPPEKCSAPDDVQSMVRFLLNANEFNVEALLATVALLPTSPTNKTFWIYWASTPRCMKI